MYVGIYDFLAISAYSLIVSIIGTFFIPCAIMVFTNVKVVLAMRRSDRAKRSDEFAFVNVVMTVLFIVSWITTCIYNSTTSVLLASTDDLEEVKYISERPYFGHNLVTTKF